MKIDGKQIAQNILDELQKRVDVLKKRGIIPHLVIILIGNDSASETYVRQKVKKGEEIGVKTSIYYLPFNTTQATLVGLLKKLNKDARVHGIVVQRPLPYEINQDEVDTIVDPQKDVDGFHKESRFQVPMVQAVLKVLDEVKNQINPSIKLETWLNNKQIVMIGKGKTGGGPLIKYLRVINDKLKIVDSKTDKPDELTRKADIIVTAVGKPHIIRRNMIKKEAILIGVGMYKGDDGKMHGDYEEDEIKDIAGFYTPVPGGVGPVNVAMLLENVVKAVENNVTS